MRPRVDPTEALRRCLIDRYVAEYDAAIHDGDADLQARLATALRELGIRL